MSPVVESALVAAGAFSAASVLTSWISDWFFWREMERMDREEKK